MIETLSSIEFWQALGAIIWVNLLLSGDNAVVIALAARSLPPRQQKVAVFWGSAAAIILRVILTVFAVALLQLPWLKLVGGVLLLWIGVKLMVPEEVGEDIKSSDNLFQAVKTILIADLVMSLDNVIAVAAAAKGNTLLLVLGLAISIPIVVFASRLLLTLMDRFPIIITLGAALLGWVAGDMAITDPIDKPWVDLNAAFLHWGAPLAGAVGVVVLGRWLAARAVAKRAVPVVAVAAAAPGHLRRVLLAVDGSPGAAQAVRRLIALRQDLRQPDIDLHLINVQRPVSGDVARFVPGQTLDDYHRERSDKALAPAREMLAAAGLAFKEYQQVGDPGVQIAQVAHAQGCDLIVMGTRGLGSHTAAIVGSVAQSTIEHASVPVMLVK